MSVFKDQDENHFFLTMPDIETDYEASYLVGILFEAGLMSSNGMSPVPLSWSEIKAWIDCTERDLSLWERLCIKQLSDEYVSELIQASDKKREAPYKAVQSQDELDLVVEREAVSSKLANLFGAFKSRLTDEDIAPD